MRTLLFFIASFILALIISTCNSVVDPPTDNNKTYYSERDSNYSSYKCCNAGIIPGCNPDETVSLWVSCNGEEYDILISAECCCEIYQYYGNPHNLYAYNISCDMIGYQVCIPDE